jgi:hypothetical protein
MDEVDFNMVATDAWYADNPDIPTPDEVDKWMEECYD